jgi:hypothetical protein
MAEPRKVYGKIRGVEITDDEIEEMVEEAEAGYDVEALRRRGPRDLNQRAADIVAEATKSPGIDFSTEWDAASIIIDDLGLEWHPPIDVSTSVGVKITR